MQIDLTYQSAQDRLCLSLRGAEVRTHWWLTRRMTLGLLKGWLAKLDEVPLPSWEHAPWQAPSTQRDLAQEHALSLEFDGPALTPKMVLPTDGLHLVDTVNITVTPTECRLQLVAANENCQLVLTRKETHTLVEAMALQVRKAGWLQALTLPDWLGVEPT
jgi:hypothetical protein